MLLCLLFFSSIAFWKLTNGQRKWWKVWFNFFTVWSSTKGGVWMSCLSFCKKEIRSKSEWFISEKQTCIKCLNYEIIVYYCNYITKSITLMWIHDWLGIKNQLPAYQISSDMVTDIIMSTGKSVMIFLFIYRIHLVMWIFSISLSQFNTVVLPSAVVISQGMCRGAKNTHWGSRQS